MLRLSLPATDSDPYDGFTPGWPAGGPTPTAVFRYQVTVTGSNAAGRDTSYVAPRTFSSVQRIDLDVDAPYIVGRDLQLLIELCDCAQCEEHRGTGRCVTMSVPVRAGATTSALVSLVEATATTDHVDVHWHVSEPGPWSVERCTAGPEWAEVAVLTPDGAGLLQYTDTSVSPGGRYGYRLSRSNPSSAVGGEVWVSVPGRPEFSLEGVRPLPVLGQASLAFALPDDRPAKLEVFDAAGRRVEQRVLSPGAGRHVVPFGGGLSPGVHVIRLTHGNRALTSRVVVLAGY